LKFAPISGEVEFKSRDPSPRIVAIDLISNLIRTSSMPLKRLGLLALAAGFAGCSESPALVPTPPPGFGTPTVTPLTLENPKGTHPPTVAATIESAMRSAKSGDLASADALLEQALKTEPKNPAALRLLTIVTRVEGDQVDPPLSGPYYHRAGQSARKFIAATREPNPGEKGIIYDALVRDARAYAFEGKKNQALRALADAVSKGRAKLEELRTDHALDSLRKEPAFAAVIEEAEKTALAVSREVAGQVLAENKPFPFTFTLPNLDGKAISLADFRGQVVIVDFWGTWCPPCRREIPHFVDLLKKYQDKGLRVVGLNFELIRDFVKQHEIPYPCLIGDDATRDKVVDFKAFPTTLFIDRKGVVRAKLEGFDVDHPAEAVALMEGLVTALLEEVPKKSPPKS
jgi:thiol-disulfide isomerase/thioredoxin